VGSRLQKGEMGVGGMRVLVSYGGKKGGTEALARAVANGLLEAGHAVDVMPSSQVDALDRWDAVVVGGTPYAWFWHRNSQRFIKRNVEDLFQAQPPLIIRLMETPPPVNQQPAPPTDRVEWPTKETPFAAPPLPPPPMPSAPQPIALVTPVETPVVAAPADPTRPIHLLVLALCLFTGVISVVGGISLLFEQSRDLYMLPGLVLFLVVGLGNFAAAALEAARAPRSELVSTVAGSSLTGWILVQLTVQGSLNWLQLLFFAIGATTVVGSLWLWRQRHPFVIIPRRRGVRFG
jgi:hypothetical protein